jgi:F0F1-type ATP synthase assembly protein I
MMSPDQQPRRPDPPHEADVESAPSGSKSDDEPEKTNWVQMSNYAELAVVFPAATVIGWLIGVGLDHWLHTTWLYIVGLLVGIAAGFVQLIRTASKNV